MRSDAGHGHPNRKSNPRGTVLDGHAMDDESGRDQETQRSKPKSGLWFPVPVVPASIAVDELVTDPSSTGLADQAAESQWHSEEYSILSSVEIVQVLGYA